MSTILVVDDDPDLADAVSDVLQAAGHIVRIAHDGWEGMDALNQGLPDLVILDIEMPSLDGPGMANLMLVQNVGRERIPILLVSAYVRLASVAKRIGTPYSLAKPCEADRLLRVVNRALSERRAPQPLSEAPRPP